jgi:hypothetical protein
MKSMMLLLALVFPCASLASTKVLLLDDIGSGKASFSWTKADGDGKVALSAIVYPGVCWDDLGPPCFGVYDTGALQGFERKGRDVFYVGAGSGEASVLCGRTQGLLARSRLYDACRVSIEPARVCQAWYVPGDCVKAVTKHRVYLTINE